MSFTYVCVWCGPAALIRAHVPRRYNLSDRGVAPWWRYPKGKATAGVVGWTTNPSLSSVARAFGGELALFCVRSDDRGCGLTELADQDADADDTELVVVRRDVGKRGGRVAGRVAGGNEVCVEVGRDARQGDGRQGLASDFGQDVGDVDGREAGTRQ